MEVAWCPELARPHAAGAIADRLAGYPHQTLTKAQISDLGFSPDPQGIVLVLKQETQTLAAPLPLRAGTWVGIESLRTPANLGTTLRSMAAAGSPGILLFSHSGIYPDIFDPGVIRASMGAQFLLQIVKTTYRQFARWPFRDDFLVLGADASGALDHRSVNFTRSVVLMLGSERTGLSPGQISACDDLVRIPMAKHVDSLNVAMAATVLLFESFDQRRTAKRPCRH